MLHHQNSKLKSSRVLAALFLARIGVAVQISIFPDVTRPEVNPRFGSTLTRPPTWSTFLNQTQFAALRSFPQDDNLTIVDYQSTLSNYSQLGHVVWPVWQTIFAPNFAEVTTYLAENNFYMTDLWGYVPGSGPGPEMWQAFTPPPENLALAASILGERWLGMDVGEQDGRYVSSYANQHTPLNAPGSQQRAFFDSHFQAMYSQLGGRVVALQSLTFAHSMAQSGAFTVVGCESGQALINAQLFYAVARGAGKQYGTLYFGNVSIYNRFGYKHYPSGGYGGTRVDGGGIATPQRSLQRPLLKPTSRTGKQRAQSQLAEKSPTGATYTCTNQNEGGAVCGTSLSLMAKLIFAQIFYNSAYVSFESSWFVDGTYTLSPVGELQAAAEEWLAVNGSPGVHMATIGLLVDAASGWTAPRNLYQDNIFYAWGNLPFAPTRGDYLTDSLLRLLYPGYQDSSYFHNETGFSAPTPYGDSVDYLLSDAPAWLLSRYDTLLLAGTPQTEPGLLRTKLEAAVTSGTHVVAWSGALGAWGATGLMNCSVAEADFAGAWTSRCPAFAAGTAVTVALAGGENTTIVEPSAFSACTLRCSGAATSSAIAWVGTVPVAWKVTAGAGVGALLIFGSPFGGPSTGVAVQDPGVDATLPSPYPLLNHIATLVDAALAPRALFSVPGLTYTVCRRGQQNDTLNADGGIAAIEYTLLVSNPSLQQVPLTINSNIGAVVAFEEIAAVSAAIRGAVGYLPDGFNGSDLGVDSNTTIAGVSTRTFRIVIDESDAPSRASMAATVRVLSTASPSPRPVGFALNIRDLSGLPVQTLRSAALAFPSLAQAFDMLIVDWAYLHRSDTAFLAAEAAFLAQTGVYGAVDFTSGLDLFPHLRLCNNSAPEYAASIATMTDVLTKVASMGWKHALFSLHRTPENNMDESTAMALEAMTLREVLAPLAGQLNITLHLRNTPGKSPVESLEDTLTFMNQNGLDGVVRPAPSLAGMLVSGDSASTLTAALARAAGPGNTAFVPVACPAYDPNAATRWWSDTVPTSVGSCTSAALLSALVSSACQAGVCVTPSETPSPTAPRIVLVVDAYIGADPFGAPLSPWQVPSQNAAGAGLDLAYAEAAWVMQSALGTRAH